MMNGLLLRRREMMAGGNDGDLSFYDVFGTRKQVQNTANSYVVKKAGTYKIPLVYGNGIKNGQTNTAAYTRQGGTYTADFVNHLGNTLTSPYIELNTGCVADSAGLLWQTSQGMIDNVSIIDGAGCRYIQFTVASAPATNGLAVLYVKDGSEDIMWSWTIWVCNDNLATFTLTNHDNVDYEMLGLPFGAIWNANRDHYTVPHFQWGRKDPMCPPSAYNSTTNMTLYDISGNTVSVQSYGVTDDADAGGTVRSVANSIKMPNKFFMEYNATDHHWNNLENFNNFWNAAETTNSSLADNQDTAIKTIYDPCLPGWTLPSGRFATGFTIMGNNTSITSYFNVIGSFDAGWKFKKNAEDIEGVYFPASGYRDRSAGALLNVGSYGIWWTFAPFSQVYARNLYFDSGDAYGVCPLNNNNRVYGFGIWPTKELN